MTGLFFLFNSLILRLVVQDLDYRPVRVGPGVVASRYGPSSCRMFVGSREWLTLELETNCPAE